ncbi:MAG: glutathionylspermidine synthase family protein [Nibricoccus sp.]
MRRLVCTPREDWRRKVEEIGLTYHSHENGPYWDESACYELTAREVDELEQAANTLHRLCIDAAEQIIERNWWDRLRIPEAARPAILQSWERDDFSLYGRFDLAYDGATPPKLLEYNADTPTSLLEASVAQWFWLEECRPAADQFNSIHERLIAAWQRRGGDLVHFASVRDHDEDGMTVNYLRDTCEQAGIKTKWLAVEDIGWDGQAQRFVDVELQSISSCFKLYPWEWMWAEDFAQHLEKASTRFLEPPWKMLLSNKGILPILWELYPEHPNLLPASATEQAMLGSYVRKPLLGREGSNVSVYENGQAVLTSDGEYGEEGFVFQQRATIPCFEGNHPIFGAWIVDHEAAGLGIREDTTLITGNLSRFVPHFFNNP